MALYEGQLQALVAMVIAETDQAAKAAGLRLIEAIRSTGEDRFRLADYGEAIPDGLRDLCLRAGISQ